MIPNYRLIETCTHEKHIITNCYVKEFEIKETPLNNGLFRLQYDYVLIQTIECCRCAKVDNKTVELHVNKKISNEEEFDYYNDKLYGLIQESRREGQFL